jgi:hypothetical protein
MDLRVVGAGLGRTGTHSLQLALQQLLGAPCYHMIEVFVHQEHVPMWQQAVDGDAVDWDELLAGYVATVDWPGAAFWRELSTANPSALVLLSVRDDAEAWWRSAEQTIFATFAREVPPEMESWHRMVEDLFVRRFANRWNDKSTAIAAYERHNEEVRASVAADRLLEWKPGDGWAPICGALDLPVPDAPFPHVNSTEDFRAMAGLDQPGT